MTSMPAASSSSMSCQRFSFRVPGTFVCASSSTSATLWPAGADGVEVHLLAVLVAAVHDPAGHELEVAKLARRVGPTVRLHQGDDHVGPRSLRRRPSLSMAWVFPTSGAAPR